LAPLGSRMNARGQVPTWLTCSQCGGNAVDVEGIFANCLWARDPWLPAECSHPKNQPLDPGHVLHPPHGLSTPPVSPGSRALGLCYLRRETLTFLICPRWCRFWQWRHLPVCVPHPSRVACRLERILLGRTISLIQRGTNYMQRCWLRTCIEEKDVREG